MKKVETAYYVLMEITRRLQLKLFTIIRTKTPNKH
jgi:hypothetical protein